MGVKRTKSYLSGFPHTDKSDFYLQVDLRNIYFKGPV